MRLRNLIGAAAIAAALPMAASAVTVVDGVSPGAYNVPGNYHSNVMFTPGDVGTLTWTFNNTSGTDQAVTIAVATVLQFDGQAYFTGGTTTSLGADSNFTPQGSPDAFFLSTIIAAGGSTDLVFEFGQVFEVPGNDVAFNWDLMSTAAPIPLPASVLMLLAALGGLGALSRRSKSTA